MQPEVSEHRPSLRASTFNLFCFILLAVARRCSVKKVFFKISQNSQGNTCARVSLLINFIKKNTLVQVFPCEFCEISKNTFFIEHLWWPKSLPL